MWIARDYNGEVRMFKSKPERVAYYDESGELYSGGYFKVDRETPGAEPFKLPDEIFGLGYTYSINLGYELFKHILTWENSPIEIV